jgi:hypothetical protein
MSRANVARAVLEEWRRQGEPKVLAASDVLQYYRREIGDISAAELNEELYLMEDDSGPMPFLRLQIQDVGGELGFLGLTDIVEKRLFELANDRH